MEMKDNNANDSRFGSTNIIFKKNENILSFAISIWL